MQFVNGKGARASARVLFTPMGPGFDVLSDKGQAKVGLNNRKGIPV